MSEFYTCGRVHLHAGRWIECCEKAGHDGRHAGHVAGPGGELIEIVWEDGPVWPEERRIREIREPLLRAST